MNLVPFETIFAKVATTIAIDVGAKSNADKLVRAEAALKVSAILKTASSGDLATASQQAQALITAEASSDPGVAAVVSDLVNVGSVFLNAKLALVSATPLVGSEIAAICGNAATGMEQIANAYISKFGPVPTPAAA